MSELSQEQIKILEQTRQHLVRILESLYSFQRAATQTPSWSSSVTSHNSILSVQVHAYYEHLSEHASFLDSLSVYPLPSFPGKTQEVLLGQFIRKKPDPEVEEWVSQAAQETENVVEEPGLEEGGESQRQLLDLWDQAPLISNECAKEHSWGGDYTKKEVELGKKNVVTGLKRKLKDLDDDEEVDEDEKEKKSVRMIVVEDNKSEGEKEDVAMQPLSLSQRLSFMTRGPPETKPQIH